MAPILNSRTELRGRRTRAKMSVSFRSNTSRRMPARTECAERRSSPLGRMVVCRNGGRSARHRRMCGGPANRQSPRDEGRGGAEWDGTLIVHTVTHRFGTWTRCRDGPRFGRRQLHIAVRSGTASQQVLPPGEETKLNSGANQRFGVAGVEDCIAGSEGTGSLWRAGSAAGTGASVTSSSPIENTAAPFGSLRRPSTR